MNKICEDLNPNKREKEAFEAGERAYSMGLDIHSNPHKGQSDVLAMFWSLGFLCSRFPYQTHITEIISSLAMLQKPINP